MVALHPRRILLVGDIALDRYTHGAIKRISPEAPVPVLTGNHTEERAGMAGNVALGLAALGQEVTLLSRIGKDSPSKALKDSLKGITLEFVEELGWQTPVKHRMVASNQQILRIDTETNGSLSPKVEVGIISRIDRLLEGMDAVAISDYGKGFCTPTLLQALIEKATAQGIPVLVDPKGRDFSRYTGSTLIKPNASEAYHAAALDSHVSLEEVAAKLHKEVKIKALMITRSEKGISLFLQNEERKDIPATPLQVRDVTGAGDTVLSVLTASLANDLSFPKAAHLANCAASLAVQRFGCVPISLKDLSLEAAPPVLVKLGGKEALTSDLVARLMAAKQPGKKLTLSMEKGSSPTLRELLSSLEFVDEVL